MKGETATLRFIEEPDRNRKFPQDLTIQMYNFKSKTKPFIIFESGNRMNYVFDRRLGSRGLDRPGACNHWPVGQAACDGRTVQAADRPTHFLGFPISSPPINEKDGRSWWNGIYGMTDLPFEKLAFVARSWNYAPELTLKIKGFGSQGYVKCERAYKLNRTSSTGSTLEFSLAANNDSPVFNPCFVVENWGDKVPTLRINEEEIKRGKKYRVGFRHTIEGSNLIIWIKTEHTSPVTVSLRAG
jgi:hypothetical protein